MPQLAEVGDVPQPHRAVVRDRAQHVAAPVQSHGLHRLGLEWLGLGFGLAEQGHRLHRLGLEWLGLGLGSTNPNPTYLHGKALVVGGVLAHQPEHLG